MEDSGCQLVTPPGLGVNSRVVDDPDPPGLPRPAVNPPSVLTRPPTSQSAAPVPAPIAPAPTPLPAPADPVPWRSGRVRAPPDRFAPSAFAATLEPEPKSYAGSQRTAEADEWRAAAESQIRTLVNMRTWDLVPRPKGARVLRSMWIFRRNLGATGVVKKHKGHPVVLGNGQTEVLEDPFSPASRQELTRILLTVGGLRKWRVRKLDIAAAFLQGNPLSEDVFMDQPEGFVDSTRPADVCKLRLPLYGLCQSPKNWNEVLQRFFSPWVCENRGTTRLSFSNWTAVRFRVCYRCMPTTLP